MSTNGRVKAGDFIYLPGMAAQDDTGGIVGRGDVAAQTRRVLERCRAALAASGSSLEQALSVTVYLTSASDFQAMNNAYRACWSSDLPARTTVITDLLTPGALVEISMVAAPAGAERTVIHPAGWVSSPNPYSYAIRSGDTVFLSGLVSRHGRDNSVVTGDVTAQTTVIMDNAGALLNAAGLTHANIVSARVYLTDVASFQSMNTAYRPYFESAPPARATVQAGLANSQYGVEMTFIASSADREVVSDGRPSYPNISTGIRAGHRVYLSGALGNTPSNAGDVRAQTVETLAKLGSALRAAGMSPADVVEVLIYLTDLTTFAGVDREYRSFFGAQAPTPTIVRSGLMAPDALVEIMPTATKF